MKTTSIKSPQDLLIDYLIWKRDRIMNMMKRKKVRPIFYITKKDLDEVKHWDKTQCIFIIKEMKNSTIYSCPWCLKSMLYKISCRTCGYAERHGNCNYSGSRYDIICKALKTGDLAKTIGYDRLEKRIAELKKALSITLSTEL